MIAKKSPASQAIELLIELAQKGEINPWDVQVIEVIDHFLAELGINDSNNLDLQTTDLSQSGQVMLWASMLVLFKAETLEKLSQREDAIENFNDFQENSELEVIRRNFKNSDLDKHLRRRTSAAPPKTRKVTLGELITQLKAMESELEEKKITHSTPLNKTKKGYTRKQALQTITELAHNENLTELAQQINEFLTTNLLTNNHHGKIPLDDLVNRWQDYQQEKSKDKVGIFWALLLLSSQSKVELHQEEFYQDLEIKLI
ncbi:ScpA family protein [Geminocystis sp. GBBB08]|uniref:ScpA family protein n=1 Tax=Geminocystis sp. GBBB08 TaxID=2604140 RepID=UPI0027E34599|nr:ScpA family protein [Geminocystis sp. GBBB08]MBL1211405.1 segregation/condensation protein A [Geminocystis sp. GBBB08]